MAQNYSEAVRLYTKAIEIKKDYVTAIFWRGKTYYYLGDMRNARKDVDLAIQLAPNEESYKTFRKELDQ